MIRLIGVDLDWTLVHPSQGVPESAWRAVEEARAAGVRFAVATGRPFGGFGLEYALRMNPEGYHAFSNGSLIARGAELVHRVAMPEATYRRMVLHSREQGLPFYVSGASGRLYSENPPRELHRFALRMGVGYERVDLLELPEPCVGGVFVITGGLWDSLRPSLTAVEGLDWLEYAVGEGEVVAVADPKGVSKASALRWVAERYGLAMEEVAMIGDSLNDLEAIRKAGLGIAMGNAEPAILEAADAVVGRLEDDGFAQAVRLCLEPSGVR
ncbi:5-amino-6-(5-phospho-D-ribitylamino)uracil phosphatase YcsE [Calidithermus terrae]|uniref:5-amino-6-(5-phospho-D-ribitylamino)uracil phosphatase YcsE n=1 Tax=Calidithermus terrae TaxID=1408545 RepID=A0A399F2A6_9DEIN|nr:HAD family hydrolase [Calidithermus terrae]RIH90213.1 5-amino-6-(5-phospho-D-ribitylamino)uracil phosphatase YcsE [Calidithermus terrae]